MFKAPSPLVMDKSYLLYLAAVICSDVDSVTTGPVSQAQTTNIEHSFTVYTHSIIHMLVISNIIIIKHQLDSMLPPLYNLAITLNIQ